MKPFIIKLEKDEYVAGETARGDILISTEKKKKDLRAEKLKFYVCGEEKIKITDDLGLPRNYEESAVFFYKDLSHFLKLNEATNGTLELSEGDWLFPFEFIIPKYAYESYSGRNATLVYEIRLTAEREWTDDVNEKVSFAVINPNGLLPQNNTAHLSEVRIRSRKKVGGGKGERGYVVIRLDL